MPFEGFVGDIYVSRDGWLCRDNFTYEFEGVTHLKDHLEHIKQTLRGLTFDLEWWEALLTLQPPDPRDDLVLDLEALDAVTVVGEAPGRLEVLYAYKGVMHLLEPLTMNQVRVKLKSDLVLRPVSGVVGEDGDEIDWERCEEYYTGHAGYDYSAGRWRDDNGRFTSRP